MKIRQFMHQHWKAAAAVFIFLLLAARIFYVNRFYPQTHREYLDMEETVSFDGLDIRINQILTYDEAEFDAYAQAQIIGYNPDIFKDGVTYNYYVYVVDVTLANHTGTEQTFAYGTSALLEIGAVSNGPNAYLNILLNQNPTRVRVAAGEEKNIRIAYTIANNSGVSDSKFAQLRDMDCTYSFKSFYKMMIVRCHSQKGR